MFLRYNKQTQRSVQSNSPSSSNLPPPVSTMHPATHTTTEFRRHSQLMRTLRRKCRDGKSDRVQYGNIDASPWVLGCDGELRTGGSRVQILPILCAGLAFTVLYLKDRCILTQRSVHHWRFPVNMHPYLFKVRKLPPLLSAHGTWLPELSYSIRFRSRRLDSRDRFKNRQSYCPNVVGLLGHWDRR